MLKIQILKKRKQWYFRIVARNGKILCHSETYSSKSKAVKSVELIKNTVSWLIETETN